MPPKNKGRFPKLLYFALYDRRQLISAHIAQQDPRESSVEFYICSPFAKLRWFYFLISKSSQVKSRVTPRGNTKAARSVNHRGLPGGGGLWVSIPRAWHFEHMTKTQASLVYCLKANIPLEFEFEFEILEYSQWAVGSTAPGT
jgi:hypothetical protein